MEIKPDEDTAYSSSQWSGKSLKEIHNLMEERAKQQEKAVTFTTYKVTKSEDSSPPPPPPPKEVPALRDTEDKSHKLTPARKRGEKKKRHKAGVYDVDDLVAKCKS